MNTVKGWQDAHTTNCDKLEGRQASLQQLNLTAESVSVPSTEDCVEGSSAFAPQKGRWSNKSSETDGDTDSSGSKGDR